MNKKQLKSLERKQRQKAKKMDLDYECTEDYREANAAFHQYRKAEQVILKKKKINDRQAHIIALELLY